VYVSVQSLGASDACGTRYGKTYSGTLVSLKTSDLYSVCSDNKAYPYHVTDLQGYVPASAWNCQRYCNEFDQPGVGLGGGFLTTALYVGPNLFVDDQPVTTYLSGYCASYIYQDWYRPWIAVPPQVRALDPAWASCDVQLGGVYDPPKTLPSVKAVASPSLSPVTSSALPSQTLTPITPQPTTQTTVQPSPTTTAVSAPETTSSTAQAAGPSAGSGTDSSSNGGQNTGTSNTGAVGGSTETQATGGLGTSQTQDTSAASSGESTGTASTGISNLVSAIVSAAESAGGSTQGTGSPSSGGSGNTATTSGNEVSSSAEGGSQPSSSSGISTSDPSNNDPTASAAGSGGSGSAAATTFTIGSQTYTASALSNSGTIVANGDSTATLALVSGDSSGQATAATLNGQTVSVASGGVVVGNGASASTVTLAQSASANSVYAVGSATVTQIAFSSGAQVLADGGSTLTVSAGRAATTVGGETISADPSGNLVVGTGNTASTASPIAPSGNAGSYTETVNGRPVTIASNPGASGMIVDGSTILPGSVATINGQTVSAGAGGVFVGSSLLKAPTGFSGGASVVSIPGESFTVATALNGNLGVDGHNISEGATATFVNGRTISAASQRIYIGDSLVPLTLATSTLDVAGQSFTIAPDPADGEFVVNSHTITEGSPATIIDGQTVSAGTDGVFIGSSFVPDAVAIESLRASAADPIEEVIDGVTLTRGGAATVIDGETVSLASGGIVVDGTMIPVPTGSLSAGQSDLLVTADGRTFTLAPVAEPSEEIVDGVTLTRGGPATGIDGETVSLASGGIVVDGTTFLIPTASATSEVLLTADGHTLTPEGPSSTKKSLSAITSSTASSDSSASEKPQGSEASSKIRCWTSWRSASRFCFERLLCPCAREFDIMIMSPAFK
jgi:hypothetical protein